MLQIKDETNKSKTGWENAENTKKKEDGPLGR
jgi:hypothetical protein